jgi:hypothetical protein
LVRLHIKTGNAVVQVTDFSSHAQTSLSWFSIQFPINGIDVLSCIPQQTPGSLHFLQGGVPDLYQVLHTQILARFLWALVSQEVELEGEGDWAAIQALYISISDWEAVVGFGACQQGENCPDV